MCVCVCVCHLIKKLSFPPLSVSRGDDKLEVTKRHRPVKERLKRKIPELLESEMETCSTEVLLHLEPEIISMF